MLHRKKTCPRCHQRLWLRDYYHNANGTHSTYCITCTRALKREEYARNRKKPDGYFFDENSGLVYEHRGPSRRIFWSEPMLEKLTKGFPNTKNEDLALDIGVSLRTLTRKARELGLVKDPAWMQVHNKRVLKKVHRINRYIRNDGMIKSGQRLSPATEFKPKKKSS